VDQFLFLAKPKTHGKPNLDYDFGF
jgi:hypothetical protein